MYSFCRPSEIKPRGWLKKQLEIQMQGLCGNLDKIWPDVRDSAWIGGDREGWERVPYWLDGFLPAAYLLGDKDAIARGERYVRAILDRQQADGWICPCTKEERANYDLWGYFLICKVLVHYCEFTGDERAADAVGAALRCLYDMLHRGEARLFDWAKFRWFECMIPLQFLYDRKPEQWILDFARLLEAEGVDFDGLRELWKKPMFRWAQETHVVNLAMMFKYEAVTRRLTGGKITGKAEKLWQFLERYNGTAVGTITGDECLAGRNNNQGTELCAVVELMYSCELLHAITGNDVWADRLEKLAFNALPATLTDDMWAHQYVQMVNQIAAVPFVGKSLFKTNHDEAHLFGLEPQFGCCTANHGQGWPLLVASLYRCTDDGIAVTSLLPSSLSTEISGVKTEIVIDTEYPFRMSGKVTVRTEKPVHFALRLHVPTWAEGCTADGKPKCGKIVLDRVWDGEQTVEIAFQASPVVRKRPNQLQTVEYGPLVFSLPIGSEWKKREYVRYGVERKFPYCDYEVWPTTEWRYGFADDRFTVNERAGGEVPFGEHTPRVTLTANLCRINWDEADGYENVAAAKPRSRYAIAKPEKLTMIPYGCAKLRMTEMPQVLFKK